MQVVVLLNAAAGPSAASHHEIEAALCRAGIDADVRTLPGEEIEEAARAAARAGAAMVVAAGGDGTVSAVAAGLVDTGARMGVLPLGTLNHFAKDVGIPLALDEAAGVLAAEEARAIDVGEVNGRVFVNNSSIGIYPDVVLARAQIRERHGVGKWLATILAAARTLMRLRPIRVLVDLGERIVPRRTSFVFVGNNRYAPPGAGNLRPSLSHGELAVYTAHSASRAALVRIALRALLGPLERVRGIDVECRRAVDVWARSSLVRVALDGEVAWLETPLRYRSREGALLVVAPPARGP